jgi:hypothetical protein
MRINPFMLSEVPADLRPYIYDGEAKSGKVYCDKLAFLVVLALRFTLTFTEEFFVGPNWDDFDEFSTWKVFWRNEQHGTGTDIFLYKDEVKVPGFWGDTDNVVQQPVLFHLATLFGHETIDRVKVNSGLPQAYMNFTAAAGIRRLIEDAARISQATGFDHPLRTDLHGDHLIGVCRRIANLPHDCDEDLVVMMDIGWNDERQVIAIG